MSDQRELDLLERGEVPALATPEAIYALPLVELTFGSARALTGAGEETITAPRTRLGRFRTSRGCQPTRDRYQLKRVFSFLGLCFPLSLALATFGPLARSGFQGQDASLTQQLDALVLELEGELEFDREVRVLLEAGYLLQDLERFPEASEYFTRGSDMARETGDEQMLVVHLGNLANVLFYVGEFKSCITASDEAITVAQSIGRTDQVWRVANASGAANLRLGDYSAAIDAFTVALDNCPPDELPGRGLLYANLATAELNVGELGRAHELLDFALTIFEEIDSPLHLGAVHATRADVFYMEGKPTAALERQTEALRIRRELGLEADVAGSLVGIGRIQADLGEFDRTLEVLEEALEIQERLELRADMVTTLGILAEVYAKLDRSEEAHNAAEESLRLADTIDLRAHRMETLYSLAKVHAAEGDPESALPILMEAIEIERGINTLETRRQMAEAESTIARHEADRSLAIEREERRAQVRGLLQIGAVGLFVATIVGWVLYLSKRKALRRLDRAHRALSLANEAEVARSAELKAALLEIHELEEERIRAAKLQALGVLAGGIAHDFNNVLTAILGSVSLARMKLADRPEVEDDLAMSEKGIDQAVRLARQLLALSRGGAPVREICDLGLLIREAAAIAASGSNSLLHYHLPQDLWLAGRRPRPDHAGDQQSRAELDSGHARRWDGQDLRGEPARGWRGLLETEDRGHRSRHPGRGARQGVRSLLQHKKYRQRARAHDCVRRS